MKLSKRLARNLRYYCDKHASIAKVCEDCQVNRQQFNKYLNGTSLPSLMVAERIAAALNITVTDLLTAEIEPAISRMSLEETLRYNDIGHSPGIKEGFYLEYFPSDVVEGRIVISLVRIRQAGKDLRFRRKMPVGDAHDGGLKYWAYDGFVFQTHDEIFIIYINSSLRENYGTYSMRHQSRMGSDLIGIKTAVSSRLQGTLFTTRSFFEYQGIRPDLRMLYRECGAWDIGHFKKGTRRMIADALLVPEETGPNILIEI